ncbi:hypothetical protein OBBRIDRAFT_829635 [Obba rivulosa]|uniref:Uncharacterized protein n=1 Tax=Obba rivulosa TaxID=1052685 RepID=A0A8E2AH71_9APHY|nr:hypothetical protein OBBRIDRAFT_829635 [Obba rivulosa]
MNSGWMDADEPRIGPVATVDDSEPRILGERRITHSEWYPLTKRGRSVEKNREGYISGKSKEAVCPVRDTSPQVKLVMPAVGSRLNAKETHWGILQGHPIRSRHWRFVYFAGLSNHIAMHLGLGLINRDVEVDRRAIVAAYLPRGIVEQACY